MSPDEIKYRESVKKVWFIKKSINKGEKIKKNNLIMKRPSVEGSHNIPLNFFINKKTLANINSNININKSMFENDITAIIVVRTASRRLKKKALKKIRNLTCIEYLIKRIKMSKKINRIILCTTKKNSDDILVKIAKKNKIQYFRGENKDVLSRMLKSIKKIKTDLVVRITGDDILIDPYFLDKTIEHHLKNNLQYTDAKNLPTGIDVEVFDKQLLETIYKLSKDTSKTEYLTFYVTDHKQQFSIGSLNVNNFYRKKIRLTLDNKKDFIVIKTFLESMHKQNKFFNHDFNDLINFYKKNKSIFKINKNKNNLLKINTSFNWKKIFN